MWTVGLSKTGNGLGLSQVEVDALEPDVLGTRLAEVHENFYRAGAYFVVDSIAGVPEVLEAMNSLLANGGAVCQILCKFVGPASWVGIEIFLNFKLRTTA